MGIMSQHIQNGVSEPGLATAGCTTDSSLNSQRQYVAYPPVVASNTTLGYVMDGIAFPQVLAVR